MSIDRLNEAFQGRYLLERELGQGGMATVYLAQDLKHDRQVAIKVLRPELAAVLGADRFVQEIRTTAQLQHPHILPLFDSGRIRAEGDDGGDGPREHLYYVMPYVRGETLRGRLDRERQLGVAEAVRIASEVADALDYAHRQGVVHRDIKPENILLQDGRPMVADFGIALAVSAAAGGRMTETGLSLGTPHYMSPEQATADREITPRSDVYSLASVLYEMLAGNPPHVGSTAQQTIMKIVAEPAAPVTEARRSVPSNVAAALAQGLEKLPADRFESARDFGRALAEPGFRSPALPGSQAGPAGAGFRHRGLLGAALFLATVLAAWGWLRPSGGAPEVVEFGLESPEPGAVITSLTLSPDGRTVVAELDNGSGRQLYRRSRRERRWYPIPGTENGWDPRISPNGDWVAFQTERGISRVPLSGGAAIQIVSNESGVSGMTWVGDDTLAFSRTDDDEEVDPGEGLVLVDVATGATTQLTDVEAGNRGHWGPAWVPGTDVVLFQTVDREFRPTISAVRIGSGEVVHLGAGMSPQADALGHVVYLGSDGIPLVQRFDVGALRLEGAPRPIAERVRTYSQLIAMMSVGHEGSLVFAASPNEGYTMRVVDRQGIGGEFTVSSGADLGLAHPRFSPDGRRIAYTVTEAADRGTLYVLSLVDSTTQRLSFDDGVADPAWSPDGLKVGYSAVPREDGSAADLRMVPADGTGEVSTLLGAGRLLWQMDFGATEAEIVFREGTDLFRSTVEPGAEPIPLTRTPAQEENPQISPDGRWLAYRSDETGREEVYVRSYPDMGPRTVVSVDGGAFPAWGGDPSRLFYQGPSRIVEARLRFDGDRVTVVERTPLFPHNWIRATANRSWDVSPDGERFVAVSSGGWPQVWRVNALSALDGAR